MLNGNGTDSPDKSSDLDLQPKNINIKQHGNSTSINENKSNIITATRKKRNHSETRGFRTK